MRSEFLPSPIRLFAFPNMNFKLLAVYTVTFNVWLLGLYSKSNRISLSFASCSPSLVKETVSQESVTFYLLPWNCLPILKMLTKNFLKISFSVISRCSLVPTSHLLQWKCARINLSQVASGMILQNHRRLPVSIFKICK
jgi:hypothetical protein